MARVQSGFSRKSWFRATLFYRVNACRIDSIRKRIADWRESGLLSDAEHVLLIADLLSATNRVANIAGTYGCFLSEWIPQSQESLEMRCRSLRSRAVDVVATTTDASNVLVQREDVVYLDPPLHKTTVFVLLSYSRDDNAWRPTAG